MSEPRTWPYFARQGPVGWSMFCDSTRLWHMYGQPQPPTKIVLVEDADGDYLGWCDADRPGRLAMVQHARIFGVQFPYGYQAEVDAGRGEAVRLRVVVRDESTWLAARPLVRAAFDVLAQESDRRASDPVALRRLAELVLRMEQAAETTGGRKVLVAACGDGAETVVLARLGFDVTAFDLSSASVARTRARLDAEGLDATLHVDDLTDLPGRRYDHGYAGVMLARAAPYLPVVEPGDCLLAAVVVDLAARGRFFHFSTTSYRENARPVPTYAHDLPLAAVAAAGHEVLDTEHSESASCDRVDSYLLSARVGHTS